MVMPLGYLGQAPPPTCIPDDQREVHIIAESVAVFAVAPFMFWLSAQKALPEWARGVSFVVGAGTVAVDGWLLWKYVTGKR